MPKVNFPAALLRKFEKRARRSFPAEEVALIVGFSTPSAVEVIDLIFPRKTEVLLKNESEIQFKESFLHRVADMAHDAGLEMVGDIHSHCWPGAVEFGDITSPSDTDLSAASDYKRRYPGYRMFAILGLSDKIPSQTKLSIYPADTKSKYKVNFE